MKHELPSLLKASGSTGLNKDAGLSSVHRARDGKPTDRRLRRLRNQPDQENRKNSLNLCGELRHSTHPGKPMYGMGCYPAAACNRAPQVKLTLFGIPAQHMV